MILRQLYITDEIGCEFHDGLNIILGINQRTTPSETRRVIETGEPRSEPRAEFPLLDRDHGAGEPDHPSHTVTSGGKVSDTNGVGKSLVVSILKHILGGDTEISLASSYFADKGFWGTLEVETGRGPLTIARPLWRPLAENLYLVIDERLDKFLEYLVSAKVKLEDVTNARELAEQIGAAGSPLGVLSKGEFQNRMRSWRISTTRNPTSPSPLCWTSSFGMRKWASVIPSAESDERSGFSIDLCSLCSDCPRRQRKSAASYRKKSRPFGSL